MTSTERPRVLLACRYPLYRLGLRSALEAAGMDVVAEVGTGPGAIEQVTVLRPDVAVVDSHVRGTPLGELFRALRDEAPGTRLLVLLGVTDQHVFAGSPPVDGYLMRECTAEELVQSIRAVLAGRPVPMPDLGALALAAYESARTEEAAPEEATARARAQVAALSPREREVLRLLARGLRNRDIAAELYISEYTVKNHVRSILDKLVLGSRVEAATYALRHGVGDPEPTG